MWGGEEKETEICVLNSCPMLLQFNAMLHVV